VVALAKGWITVYWLREVDFNASTTFAAGIPRKEGMKALGRLWNMLSSLSQKTQGS
jgi:hypothetical protein